MARFLIAGAGIGGLTAAIALARTGATVSLIERADTLREIGAGVQLSPNATRILERMGLLDQLAAAALEPLGIRVRNGWSGRLLSFMPLEDARRRWGAPFLVVHRAELQSILADAAASNPSVTIDLNTVLAGFGTTESGVLATTKQGRITQTFRGDALIGADGVRSTVRARLVETDERPKETGRTAWRALVPADALDPTLRTPEVNLWLGADAHLVHYPLGDGQQINVVAVTRDSTSTTSDSWSGPGDSSVVQRRFARWDKDVQCLIGAALSWTTWPLYDRRPLGAWHAGRVALIGDAAHPILPFLAQGSAQAIEDAAAIAAAVVSETDIERAFAVYSRRRMNRATRVQQASRQLGRIYHLSGVEAAMRDFAIRLRSGRGLLARYDWLYHA